MGEQSVQSLLPRVVPGKTLDKQEMIEHIKERTGFHKSDIVAMLAEIEDTLLHFLKMGRPVRLEGIGLFTTSVRLNGEVKVHFRLETHLKEQLNLSGAYTGQIKNKNHIGKSLADLQQIAQSNGGSS